MQALIMTKGQPDSTLMPRLATYDMPPRPKKFIPASKELNKTPKILKESEGGTDDSCLTPGEFGDTRTAIIDSGCSSDTHPQEFVIKNFPREIKPLIKPVTFETASTPIKCNKGMTVQVGPWDIPLQVTLSLGAPSLISIGQRVMQASMSFFWINKRHPCIITADFRYIVIFEIDGNVPIYAPCFENLKFTFLGTFELAENAFWERCGISVDKTGRIISMLQMQATQSKNVKHRETQHASTIDPTRAHVASCDADANRTGLYRRRRVLALRFRWRSGARWGAGAE